MNETPLQVSEIRLSGIGKKFNNKWIFKGIDFVIRQGERIAVHGSNGSGKSTFLKMISGYLSPIEGTIEWYVNENKIPVEQVYNHISFAGPYLELVDHFTLNENVAFFCRMKKLLPGTSQPDIINIAGLESASEVMVHHLSSGMKQKVKLTLAFLANSSVLLLDEPLSNLDESGYEWYKNMSETYLGNRILLVCSNRVKEETAFCNRVLDVENFKNY